MASEQHNEKETKMQIRDQGYTDTALPLWILRYKDALMYNCGPGSLAVYASSWQGKPHLQLKQQGWHWRIYINCQLSASEIISGNHSCTMIQFQVLTKRQANQHLPRQHPIQCLSCSLCFRINDHGCVQVADSQMSSSGKVLGSHDSRRHAEKHAW